MNTCEHDLRFPDHLTSESGAGKTIIQGSQTLECCRQLTFGHFTRIETIQDHTNSRKLIHLFFNRPNENLRNPHSREHNHDHWLRK